MKKRIRLKRNIKFKIKNKVVIISILVFFNSIFILILFNKNTKPILLNYAKNKIEIETRKVIVDVVNSEYNSNKYSYKDFLYIVNNSNGEIAYVDYDTIKINELLNNVTLDLISRIKNIESDSFSSTNKVYYIPFGAVMNIGSSNWVGPQIPIKIMTSLNLETKVDVEIKDYGINNVLLEIYIDICVYTNILLPYTKENISVNYKVPIVKELINGKIPSIYGGMYSTSSNIKRQLLE